MRGGAPVEWVYSKGVGSTYHVVSYLADESALSWLMELRAEERVEPARLATGEGGGGRPAWENSS